MGDGASSKPALFSQVAKDSMTYTWGRTTGRNPDLDHETARRYEIHTTALVKEMGDLRVDKITTDHVQAVIDAMKQKYAGGYCTRRYNVARGILDIAIEKGMRTFNPLRDKPCKSLPSEGIEARMRSLLRRDESGAFVSGWPSASIRNRT